MNYYESEGDVLTGQMDLFGGTVMTDNHECIMGKSLKNCVRRACHYFDDENESCIYLPPARKAQLAADKRKK